MQGSGEWLRVVVCDRLPGEKMNPKMFFEIQDDDLEVKLARLPMTEGQDTKGIEEELEKCKGKIFYVRKDDTYEQYIYTDGQWHMIGEVR